MQLIHVANAVAIFISQAVASAHANGVDLVAVAIAVVIRNVFATASVNRARAVANTAFINDSHAKATLLITDAVGERRIIETLGVVAIFWAATRAGVGAYPKAVGISATSVVLRDAGVVVSCRSIRASCAGQIFTASVVEGGCGVVVARSWIGTAFVETIKIDGYVET